MLGHHDYWNPPLTRPTDVEPILGIPIGGVPIAIHLWRAVRPLGEVATAVTLGVPTQERHAPAANVS